MRTFASSRPGQPLVPLKWAHPEGGGHAEQHRLYPRVAGVRRRFEAVWVLVMLPAMLFLLRAELRTTPTVPIEEKPTADVRS